MQSAERDAQEDAAEAAAQAGGSAAGALYENGAEALGSHAPTGVQASPKEASARDAAPIALHAVRKVYRTGGRAVEALRGVDLTIGEPGFYAIMGPSGSGKSTLLHLIAGLDRPDGGAIRVSGEQLESMSEQALTEYRLRRIGIVFQRFNLIPTLSALENVALPGLLDGWASKRRRARAAALLEMLNMSKRAEHRPDALSGGEQQRVAIARALFFEPRVLLADEPTGNLDSRTSEVVWKLLGDIANEQQLTVVMVTHEPEAAAHCRMVHLLRDGKLAGSISTDGIHAKDLATKLATGV